MTKTLTGYNVMSRFHNKDTLSNVIFAFKMSLLHERHLMAVVINMHKPYFIFKTCHFKVMKVSCQAYAHPFK